ncbi:chromosome segregation protein smc1, putative [Eimeria brunetti]|uniref:Chromosome segregation protein smc1, putative n=1 Tax=Eimeria brunetti TaxID=51314 RepID=U6LRL0_9EIME|nr:chromosome segregation protein smc1, putative [Eimeria brunetti]
MDLPTGSSVDSSVDGSQQRLLQQQQEQELPSMECDSPTALSGGWGLALPQQQQQQHSSSISQQPLLASGFPCSIASLFEDPSQVPPPQQQQQQQQLQQQQSQADNEQQPQPQQQQPQKPHQQQQEPPAAAAAAAAAAARFFLEYIVLENFKSYRGKHVIGPLQSSVAIIGANGTAVSLHFRRRAAAGCEGELLLLRRQISSSSSSCTYSGDSSVTAAARSPLELTRLIERVGSSEEWAEQFAAAAAAAAALHSEARQTFSSKQQLLAAVRVLRAQQQEVKTFKEMQQQHVSSKLLQLLQLLLQLLLQVLQLLLQVLQLLLQERGRQKQQQQRAAEEGQRAELLLQQLQQQLQKAEAADRKRISLSLQLEQKKTLVEKSAMKTSMLRSSLAESLERLRFAEQQQQQQQQKLQQKEEECRALKALEDQLSSEVIRLCDEQQHIKAAAEEKEKTLQQKLSKEQQQRLLLLQQQADSRLTDLKQQMAKKQPLLQQATSALDILERECLELERRISCLRELAVGSSNLPLRELVKRMQEEARQKQTAAAETLQQLLSDAASVKESLKEATENANASTSRREELQQLHAELQQQLSLEAIQYMKDNGHPAIDFLPLDRLREQQMRSSSSSSEQQHDIHVEGSRFLPPPNPEQLPPHCRWAVDCISCEQHLRPVVEFVLSDCIVVPSLLIAQQLKNSHFSRYRFVTLEGERLQHSGVFSIDAAAAAPAAAAAAAAGRMHAKQHSELLQRAEEVAAELHKIDALESGSGEFVRRKQQQLERLHRLSLQQQTKQKAWEQQQEHQQQQLDQLLQQHAQLKQRCELQRQKTASLAKEVEREASADAQAAAMVGFGKELKLPQGELRELLLQQQQQQQQRSAVAKLHVQQLRLEAELKDCRSRLEAAVAAAEAARAAQQHQQQEQQAVQQLATYERQLAEAEQQHEERLQQQQQQQQQLQQVEGELHQLRQESDRLLREKAEAAAAAAAAAQLQQQQQQQILHLLRQADAIGLELPLQRGTWKDVQQFINDADRQQQQQQQQQQAFEALRGLSFDWQALPPEKRAIIERESGSGARVQQELQRLREQQQQLHQRLQELNPNFKVEQKLQEVEAQLKQQEELQQQQRQAAAAAEAKLKTLRTQRREAFMKCFLHCQNVLSLIFAHLSAGGPVQDPQQQQQQQQEQQQQQDGANAGMLMLEDNMQEPWQQQQQQQFDAGGAQAFLDLESSAAFTREEEPFNCGVSLICKFPTKRFMQFQQLSGGEQHVAGLSLALALSSFNSKVPFLLLDEIDAHLDKTRLGRLASLLREISGGNKIQCIFITHKERLFTAADLLIGVVEDAAPSSSRCFFFDVRPYRNRDQPCPAN